MMISLQTLETSLWDLLWRWGRASSMLVFICFFLLLLWFVCYFFVWCLVLFLFLFKTIIRLSFTTARPLRRRQIAPGKWRQPQRQVFLRLGDQPRQPLEHPALEPPPLIRRWSQLPRQTGFHSSYEVLSSPAGRSLGEEGVVGETRDLLWSAGEDLVSFFFCFLKLKLFSFFSSSFYSSHTFMESDLRMSLGLSAFNWYSVYD